MKSVLINLHNHLLNNDGNFCVSVDIKKNFINFEKVDCQKIYAFTDHFSTILNLYKKDELCAYKDKLSEISKQYSKKKLIFWLVLK